MDREKQKKLERERMELERAKVPKDDGVEHHADEEGREPHVPRKSKFVSHVFSGGIDLVLYVFSSNVVSAVCDICVKAIFLACHRLASLLVVCSHEMLLVTLPSAIIHS